MPIPRPSPAWLEAYNLRTRRDVDGLLRALESPELELRREAAMALGILGDQKAIPALHQALEGRDGLLKFHAACALARLGDFPVMLQFLGDERPPFFPGMKMLEFDPWEWIRPLGKSALPGVLREMEYPLNFKFVQTGADLAIQHQDHGLVPILWGLLSHEDYRIRAVAAHKLGALPEDETPAKLIPLLGDEVEVVAERASDALRSIGRISVPALIQATKDKNEALHSRAARLLEQLQPAETRAHTASIKPPAPQHPKPSAAEKSKPPTRQKPGPAPSGTLPIRAATPAAVASGTVQGQICINCGNDLEPDRVETGLCSTCSTPPAAGMDTRKQEPDKQQEKLPERPAATRKEKETLPGPHVTPEPPRFIAPAELWLPGQVVADIYTIEKELGRGGMGVVYLAREGKQGRLVAIKSPLGEFINDPVARKRFTGEATAWMDLGSHPNVVRAFDVQEVDYRPRIFMEYCDGGSLASLLSQHPKGLSWQEVYDLLAQMCWAVGFAHGKGLVHRDLKPANILLISDGTVKVTDFGLVRLVIQSDQPDLQGAPAISEDQARIRGGTEIVGTPQYMAPEQWSGAGIGPAVDVYALGLILFELCTGARAFDLATHPFCRAKDIAPIARTSYYRMLHCEQPPLSAADLREDIPVAVCQIIERCLAKDLKIRPASAFEIAQDLSRALESYGVDISRRSRPGEIAIAVESKRDQAWAMVRLGAGATQRGDLQDAEGSQRKALALFEDIQDRRGASVVYLNLGNICSLRNQYDQAAAFFNQAIDELRLVGDTAGMATCYMNLGILHDERAEYKQAKNMFEKALRTMESLGDREGMAKCYLNLGSVHGFLNEYDTAVSMYQKALSISEQMQDGMGIALCLLNLGAIHRMRAEFKQAIQRFEQALPIMESIGDRSGLAKCYTGLGNVYSQTGQYDTAIDMYQQGARVAKEIDDQAREAGCYTGLGAVYVQLGEVDRGEQMFKKASAIFEAIGERAELAKSYINLATVEVRRGDYRNAFTTYKQALDVFEEIGERSGQAKCCLGLGGVHCQGGDFKQGMVMFERARSLAEEIGDGETLAQSYIHLARGYEIQHQPRQALVMYQKGRQLMREMGIPVQKQMDMKIRELGG